MEMEEIMKAIRAFLKKVCSNPRTKNVSCNITFERNKEGDKFAVTRMRIIDSEFFPTE